MDLLPAACTRAHVPARSRKAVLDIASELIAASSPELSERALLEGLLDRERLGSTGLGEGAAIPHCRDATCKAPAGALITLAQGIDFDAPDGAAVDVLFVLVVPENETRQHLEILGTLARVFDDPTNLADLRGANTDRELFDTMHWQIEMAQQE